MPEAEETVKVDSAETSKDPDAGAKTALEAERKARREAEQQAKDLAAKLQKFEDDGKSEIQRLTEENARLTRELGTATVTSSRYKVALDNGLSATQAKRLVGETEEELTADAAELLADLGGKETEPKPVEGIPAKPVENLKPGTGTEQPVDDITDVKAIGERMFAT